MDLSNKEHPSRASLGLTCAIFTKECPFIGHQSATLEISAIQSSKIERSFPSSSRFELTISNGRCRHKNK